MQTPCAYCKEIGHHIRYCNVLADKNRSQKSPIVVVVNETKVIVNNKTQTATNKFAQLYSSDEEEIEEGEIVEDISVRFASLNSDISSCDSDYSCENENKWNRSGVKSVFIPHVRIEQEEEEYEPCYYKSNFEYYNIPGGEEILMYIEKMRGMTWVDIECDSDFE